MDKIFPYNEVVEKQLVEIKKLIRLSMNGVASESMRSLGYSVNYGVALSRIREIAGRFPQDHLLAQRLWAMEQRETMLLATLIEPSGCFPEPMADAWATQCFNLELTRQCCHNLFVRLPYANRLSVHLLMQESRYEKAAGYILYALLLKQGRGERELFPVFMKQAKEDIRSDSYAVYTSIAHFLKQAGANDRDAVNSFLAEISGREEKSAKWVYEEIDSFFNLADEINGETGN